MNNAIVNHIIALMQDTVVSMDNQIMNNTIEIIHLT